MWNLKFLKIKLLVAWMCSRIPIITIFHYINIHRFRSLNILMFTGSEVWFRQSIQSTRDISNPEGTGQTVRDTQSFSDNQYLHISIDILWIINKIIIRLKVGAYFRNFAMEKNIFFLKHYFPNFSEGRKKFKIAGIKKFCLESLCDIKNVENNFLARKLICTLRIILFACWVQK